MNPESPPQNLGFLWPNPLILPERKLSHREVIMPVQDHSAGKQNLHFLRLSFQLLCCAVMILVWDYFILFGGGGLFQTHWRREWQPTPVFLPGKSQGRGSLVGCHLWGHTELDTTKVTQQHIYMLFLCRSLKSFP